VSLDSSGRLRDLDTGRLLPRDVDLSLVRAVRATAPRVRRGKVVEVVEWRTREWKRTPDPFRNLEHAAGPVRAFLAEASAASRRDWKRERRGRAWVLSGSPLWPADAAEFMRRAGPETSIQADRELAKAERLQIVARVRRPDGGVDWVPLSHAIGGHVAWTQATAMLEGEDLSPTSRAVELEDCKVLSISILAY
jgi:hypothetical protein